LKACMWQCRTSLQLSAKTCTVMNRDMDVGKQTQHYRYH